jgi:hypothetical protein
LVAAALVGAGPAGAAGEIHPGVQLYTHDAQCTSNFVFSDGPNAYIGQAAHCSGLGTAADTNGCDTRSLPLGTNVLIVGASKPGVMVYNSWLAMQSAHEGNDDACDFNDFALVRIDPADVARVDPAIPSIGGPTGLNTSGPKAGDSVASYGNSGLRAGISFLSPKHGSVLDVDGNGWNYDVFTLTPGIPGDSGSGFIDAEGRAFGVLSTIGLTPVPAANGVNDLSRELAYAKTHGAPDVHVVTAGSPVIAPPATAPAPAPAKALAKKHKKKKPSKAKASKAKKKHSSKKKKPSKKTRAGGSR